MTHLLCFQSLTSPQKAFGQVWGILEDERPICRLNEPGYCNMDYSVSLAPFCSIFLQFNLPYLRSYQRDFQRIWLSGSGDMGHVRFLGGRHIATQIPQ